MSDVLTRPGREVNGRQSSGDTEPDADAFVETHWGDEDEEIVSADDRTDPPTRGWSVSRASVNLTGLERAVLASGIVILGFTVRRVVGFLGRRFRKKTKLNAEVVPEDRAADSVTSVVSKGAGAGTSRAQGSGKGSRSVPAAERKAAKRVQQRTSAPSSAEKKSDSKPVKSNSAAGKPAARSQRRPLPMLRADGRAAPRDPATSGDSTREGHSPTGPIGNQEPRAPGASGSHKGNMASHGQEAGKQESAQVPTAPGGDAGKTARPAPAPRRRPLPMLSADGKASAVPKNGSDSHSALDTATAAAADVDSGSSTATQPSERSEAPTASSTVPAPGRAVSEVGGLGLERSTPETDKQHAQAVLQPATSKSTDTTGGDEGEIANALCTELSDRTNGALPTVSEQFSIATTAGSDVASVDAVVSESARSSAATAPPSQAGSTAASAPSLKGYKLSANAPAFVPSSTQPGSPSSAKAASVGTAVGMGESTVLSEGAAAAAEGGSTSAGSLDGSTQPDAPVQMAAAVGDGAEGEAAEGKGDADEFEHAPLELVGAAIPPDAPPTDDEAEADKMLAALAARLQQTMARTGRLASPQVREAGRADMQQDLAFCRSHLCRPSKYAEHASTAADFLVQAAGLAGNRRLEDILSYNLATCLRRTGRPRRAAALLRAQLERAMSAPGGLCSPLVATARDHLMESLAVLSRFDEAREVAEKHIEGLDKLMAAEAAAVGPDGGDGGSSVRGGDGEASSESDDDDGTGEDDVKPLSAVAAATRARLDFSKLLATQDAYAAAIDAARDATDLSRGSESLVSEHASALLALGGLLRTRVRRVREGNEGAPVAEEGASGLMREARGAYLALVDLIEEHEPASQRAPALHRVLAELCMELGDATEAYDHARKMLNKLARVAYGEDHQHPDLQQAWEFIASLHETGGDVEGATNAHKMALKCKSSVVKRRDTSHKAKQHSRRAKQ